MSYSTLKSSFCKNCDNFMDITNNISNALDNVQLGGDMTDGLSEVQIESSDYGVSISDSGGINSNITDDEITNLLDGSDTSLPISKKFNISDLNKNPSFNKLSNELKTLVINRILENTPKQKQSKSNINSTKKSYFYCKNCGYNEEIPNQKFIFSRGSENKNEILNNNFMNFVNDNTLPRTKNYNCINSKCSSHSNPNIKLAVFYRHKNSYNIRYICQVCNNYWDIYNQTQNT